MNFTEDEVVHVNGEKRLGCGASARSCPPGALRVIRESLGIAPLGVALLFSMALRVHLDRVEGGYDYGAAGN